MADSCIQEIINVPIIDNTHSLLYHLCSNSLGGIINFMMRVSKPSDLVNTQDDDGNTPLHLLCSRIDDSKMENVNCFKYINDWSSFFSCFTSQPSLETFILVFNYLSGFADFSIKNNEGKTIDETTDNTLIHNMYYNIMNNSPETTNTSSTVHQKVLLRNSTNIKDIPNKENWSVLFSLKDSNNKNRILLHHLCSGDRLSAIKLLIENGAKTNGEKGNFSSLNGLFTLMDKSLDEYSSVKIYVPSGFRHADNIILDDLKKNSKLSYNERKLLEETEEIALYLADNGATSFALETFYCISDILYRIYKKKN
ncbi:hypothetical protein BCR32DRAFT_328462 [Anaeromyces robustus]|uniref:Ankyrin n=1 Tax=Anaeromyces robustus TaxID=1754192 RepID=A0A1Y1WZ69_9FUNG|nr:hypothetical protein BCR32DRAFT_328462 [Anaeromyces robustus]|eukprot:ORX78638.1 hypothetical protein BCR32DRAFT_328462 [Anaeromyces robustus]